MGPVGRHHRLVAGAAQAPLAVVAVHQAVVGAQGALVQDVVGRGNLFLEQTLAVGF